MLSESKPDLENSFNPCANIWKNIQMTLCHLDYFVADGDNLDWDEGYEGVQDDVEEVERWWAHLILCQTLKENPNDTLSFGLFRSRRWGFRLRRRIRRRRRWCWRRRRRSVHLIFVRNLERESKWHYVIWIISGSTEIQMTLCHLD